MFDIRRKRWKRNKNLFHSSYTSSYCACTTRKRERKKARDNRGLEVEHLAMRKQQAGLNAHKAQGDFRSSQMYTQQKKKLLTKKNSVCHHWQRDPSFKSSREDNKTQSIFSYLICWPAAAEICRVERLHNNTMLSRDSGTQDGFYSTAITGVDNDI